MKHYILAKWNEKVTDKAALLPPITAIFSTADTSPAFTGRRFIPVVLTGKIGMT